MKIRESGLGVSRYLPESTGENYEEFESRYAVFRPIFQSDICGI
jgi:hypothetical protein